MAELLGGAQPVALGAQASDVLVRIAAATTERDDVIRHGCCHDQPFHRAVTAQWLGSKATLALGDAAAPS